MRSPEINIPATVDDLRSRDEDWRGTIEGRIARVFGGHWRLRRVQTRSGSRTPFVIPTSRLYIRLNPEESNPQLFIRAIAYLLWRENPDYDITRALVRRCDDKMCVNPDHWEWTGHRWMVIRRSKNTSPKAEAGSAYLGRQMPLPLPTYPAPRGAEIDPPAELVHIDPDRVFDHERTMLKDFMELPIDSRTGVVLMLLDKWYYSDGGSMLLRLLDGGKK